jgi:hypothetical protein
MKNLRSKHWGYLETGLWVGAVLLMGCCRQGFLDEVTTGAFLIFVVCAAYGVRHYTRHRYRDYVFEPMRPDELPRDTYAVFNSCTPEFMQLGCGLVGDFRLAYAPHPVFIRYFLLPDKRVKAQVSDWDGRFTPSFTTYFADGRLLETAITDGPGQKLSDDSKLWFFKYGPLSIAELYERHRQAIDAYEASHQVSALAVAPSHLAELAQYGHRLVWWERGKLPKHLGQPRLPDMEPVSLEPVILTQ